MSNVEQVKILNSGPLFINITTSDNTNVVKR